MREAVARFVPEISDRRGYLLNYPCTFIRVEDWTSDNPDLNPLDYKLWNILEQDACQKRHPNLESLK